MKQLTSGDEVLALLYAPAASAALRVAISTGLLWSLAERPMNGEEVSKALHIPGKRGHYWLQYLQSFGILETTPLGYVPSQLIFSTILRIRSRESWQHTVLFEEEMDAGVHGLSQFIAEPGSLWAIQSLAEPRNYVDKMRADSGNAREFVHLLFDVHQQLAQQIADLLDLTGVERMMDLGGNSGVMSMALLKKYPGLTSTVIDIENVCAAGRELAAEQGFADCLTYQPAEFHCDEFPVGFDLILQCDVSVYSMELFQKLHRSLNPGGRIIFVEHFSLAKNLAPATRIEWTFLDSLHDPNICFPTLDEIRMQLTQAGFAASNEHQTVGRGWIVLEAQKSSQVLPGASHAS